MREPVRDKERIQHILDAIETIESSRLKYSTSESASDPIIYYGFVKHVEIIGELSICFLKNLRQPTLKLNGLPLKVCGTF